MVVYRHRENLLGPLLADDIGVQKLLDLNGLRDPDAPCDAPVFPVLGNEIGA